MSVLKMDEADFKVTGRTLPPSDYVITILDARIEATENGKRLTRMYGNIRTRDGSTEVPPVNGGAPFRIGNRKLFARSWIEHTNEQAQSIGNREIKHEAVSAGLVAKPGKGESVELNVDDSYAASLVGKDVIVRTKIRTSFKDATGQIVRHPTPEQMQTLEKDEQAEISAWLQP